MRRPMWILGVLLVWILISGRLEAQPVTVGGEFQVNSYTTSFQKRPSVAVEPDGEFVVVWRSNGSSGTHSSGYSIQGQRYGSDGLPVGGEFQVNTYTTSTQGHPSVAVEPDGDFVVVWHGTGSPGTDSSSYSIQGQRYGSDRLPVGDQFQINSYTTNRQVDPSVAVDQNGDFVVVWDSEGSSGTDSSERSIQGQRYGSDGLTMGREFQVNAYTTSYQRSPSVAADPEGGFVVVWYSFGSSGTDSSSSSIQGQRYGSDGLSVGSEFQVNTYTTSNQQSPSVAADPEGGFVVVWTSNGSSGTDSFGFSVQGQRHGSDGSPVGSEFQVNTYTTQSQGDASAAFDPEGGFVVVWNSNGSSGTDSSNYSIQGQHYGSDGLSVGSEFQVNTYTTNFQRYPSMAFGAGADFVVVWSSYLSSGTDSYFSIQGQRFEIPFFADGFESGDTSAW